MVIRSFAALPSRIVMSLYPSAPPTENSFHLGTSFSVEALSFSLTLRCVRKTLIFGSAISARMADVVERGLLVRRL